MSNSAPVFVMSNYTNSRQYDIEIITNDCSQGHVPLGNPVIIDNENQQSYIPPDHQVFSEADSQPTSMPHAPLDGGCHQRAVSLGAQGGGFILGAQSMKQIHAWRC